MKRILSVLAIAVAATAASAAPESPAKARIDKAQIPKWSADDLEFFLHGSMSTEVVPERVLQAFIKIYPELFPASDLAYLGLIPDPKFGWPIGFSRKKEVKHLGGMSAVGINCASCHVAQIRSGAAKEPFNILGATSHFNVEAFFGSVLVATFKTSDPANMKKFLSAYLTLSDPKTGSAGQKFLEKAWQFQEKDLLATLQDDPFGAKDVPPGELHPIDNESLELTENQLTRDGDIVTCTKALVKLFHNMRAALHVPDQPPEKAPPASGPGRNDAFGLLSAALLNTPLPYAPIKFGLVWNVDQRTWVHWDGNTKSPLARNLLASLGLGAPLHGKRGDLDFATVKRQTDLSESIRPPKYPFAIDRAAAKRGAAHFESNCASCHGGPESDKRLYPIAEVGTDPHRAELFTGKQAEGFNKFLAELEAVGYEPPKEFGVRSTGKYWAATLSGVWARSPYLHNGSVRTMQELLTAPGQRAKNFHRGAQEYDSPQMGYTDAGAYVFETANEGNSNAGHDYGTKLTAEQKRDLMEYLKTL
jgi:processive rubber oxygenase RoxA-like protein